MFRLLYAERKNKDVEHIREKRRVLADLQDTWLSQFRTSCSRISRSMSVSCMVSFQWLMSILHVQPIQYWSVFREYNALYERRVATSH